MDKKINKYIEERLDHWAQWVLKGNFSLGYPTKSILYDWLKFGCVIRQGYQKDMISYDQAAEEVEASVVALYRYDQKLALALRLQYLFRWSTNKKASEMRICVTQYNIYVKLAKHWVAGKLTQ